MNRFYRLCLVLILFTTTFTCTALFAGTTPEEDKNLKVIVSKIRVFLDDEELLTEENEKSFSGKFNRETILSFTKLAAGKEYSIAKLEQEIKESRIRLLNSGYFYNASVEKLESRKNKGTYIIYINVTTGFLKRYGGGGIFALFGDAGLHGNREQLLWYAGWNKNGLSYLYENVCGTPLILGADLFTDAPYGFTNENGVNINGKATAGFFLTPDLRFCVDCNACFNFNSLAFEKDFTISSYLSQTKYFSEKISATSEFCICEFPFLNWNTTYEGAGTVNYTPVKQITLAALICGGISPDKEPAAINLSRNESGFHHNQGLANRCVRSGYSEKELLSRSYILGTFEIRWNAFSFTVPPCFPCNVIPYAYSDFCATEKLCDEKGNISFLDAYGVGLQLNFTSPVFAYFNFSYGFNRFGKGKFCFAAVQSF